MGSKGVAFLRVLALVAAIGIAAGCAETRKLQGANAQLVNEKNDLTKQVDDLKGMLAQANQKNTELENELKKVQADVDYLQGQAGAYKGAYEENKKLGQNVSEQVMRELVSKMPGAVLIPGGGIRLPSDIYFDSGKSELKAEAQVALKQAADAFQGEEARGLDVRIDGHTDSQPIRHSKWKDNMELSQARARSVWLALKNEGVSPERMFTAGFGEFKPIDTNATADGRRANRRVEIWLVPASRALPSASESTGAATPAPAEELPEPTK